MTNPTLITGCALSIPNEGKALWGDLWFVGDCFVFNGNKHGFDAAWMRGDEADVLTDPARFKAIILLGVYDYFERCGVVVFRQAHARFNPLAQEHMRKWNPGFQQQV